MTGILLVLVAAVAFGFMPTFASWARRGVSMEMMLALRFGIAAVVLAGIVIAGRLAIPKGRTLAALAVMGALGYAGQSYCYFTALRQAPSVLVVLLFFLYPVTLSAIAWALFRERLSRPKLAAMAIGVAGLLLMLAPMVISRPVGGMFLAVLLALISGVIYATYVLAGIKIAPAAGAIQAALIITASAAVVFIALAVVRNASLPQGVVSWGGVVSLALISTVGGITCFLAGLSLIGPARAATLSVVEPITAVVAGVLLLNERLNGWQIAGGALILAAAIVAAQQKPRS